MTVQMVSKWPGQAAYKMLRTAFVNQVYCNFRVRLNPKLIKTSILSNTDGGENPPKLKIIDGSVS
ncbi:hypothetical protein SESBI_26310 [Sesbania bispinosa]|nr:hypothetical protein SESBI_26310 [Sesbania bispinosa]